jgi:hypothetical protein
VPAAIITEQDLCGWSINLAEPFSLLHNTQLLHSHTTSYKQLPPLLQTVPATTCSSLVFPKTSSFSYQLITCS